MQKDDRLVNRLQKFPFIAILRGIHPEEALDIAAALLDCGFGIIEVPLNSPNPIESIRLLSNTYGHKALVGAGTVRTIEEVQTVAAAGGQIALSPHCDAALIRESKACGMISLPGIATPTEAFTALQAGADALKLFPAEAISPIVMRAMATVLPPETALLPVGGIRDNNWQTYYQYGAAGFGLGSSLYKRGDSAKQVRLHGQRFQKSWQQKQR